VIAFLARRGLFRHRSRTLLGILGVGVAGALLLDMQMLSRGLQVSLQRILREIGYEIRVTPRDTLPFETEASFAGGHRIAAEIAADPRVARAAPVLGGSVYATTRGRGGRAGAASQAAPAGSPLAAFVYGMDPPSEALWRVTQGHDLGPADSAHAVVSRALARDLGLAVGDTLFVARDYAPQIGMLGSPRAYVVAGLAEFRFDLRTQRSLALLTRQAQVVRGESARDGLSMLVIGLRDARQSEEVATWIRTHFPSVTAYSVHEILAAVQGQLAYFNLFSLVLGSVSFVVCVLLVGTMVTLSLGERLGEMAILRALGLRRRRLVALVVLEGFCVVVLSLPVVFGAGQIISVWLDGILRRAPSIPAELHFFVLTPRAAWRTLALLVVSGTLAGAYPAWLVSRMRIAPTLHREVMG
jgi:putative ABC transport system permease protein